MEGGSREEQPGPMSQVKKTGLSFVSSLQEAWQYLTAAITGHVKALTARTEKEASEAELQKEKRQVEATDAAEDRKKQLEM